MSAIRALRALFARPNPGPTPSVVAMSWALVLGAWFVPGTAATAWAEKTPAATPASEPATESGPEVLRELWYRVDLDGQSAGWTVTRELQEGDERISEMELHLELSRGGVAQTMEMSNRFVETPDHRPLRASARQKLGPAPMETAFRFATDGVWIRGATGERRVDGPSGPWLTPMAAQEQVAEWARKVAEDDGAAGRGAGDAAVWFDTTTIDPQMGISPVTTTWTLEAPREVIETGFGPQTASRWSQSQSLAPQLVTRVHLSEDGEVLRTATAMMGVELVSTLTRRDIALGHEGAPEMLLQSLLLLDEPIPEPRSLRRAVYRLSMGDGEAVVPLPSLGPQRVERLDDGGLRVVLDLDAKPVPGRPPGDEHLAPSAFLDSADPDVLALHRKAVEGLDGAAPAARAEALRRRVHRHLTAKGLDSMLATAGDVARSRSGDCTEHAVLLGALLRADGIPSRVATGLVYVDRMAGKRHLFGYHMWTQGWLGDRWVDLDATLPQGAPYDAAHILFETATLADDGSALAEMAGITPLIGRLQLEVLALGD
ncbi:MAG: transglutaminase-like domain-containing protein [Acidobacteriota bacterium]